MEFAPSYKLLAEEVNRRILLLDGAMGTMVSKRGLRRDDYEGCCDLLCYSHPEIVKDIHRQYLDAGADIISTNTFNATVDKVSKLKGGSYALCRRATELARDAIAGCGEPKSGKPRFVAGTVGPALADEGGETIETYLPVIEGLLDGGCDIILIETIFNLHSAKTILSAISKVARNRGVIPPIMLSVTVSDSIGQILSGESMEEILRTTWELGLFSLGINCSNGSSSLHSLLKILSCFCESCVSCHPNAGLPDAKGIYGETPEIFAENIREYLEEGLLNIVGGCCGTTPEHIKRISEFINDYTPRRIAKIQTVP